MALIRNGKLCRSCSVTKCVDKGTEQEPLELECPACDGVGCDDCGGMGYMRIEGCPKVYCSQIVPTMQLIELFENGLPPIAGGVLDQSASFITAAKHYASESRMAEAQSSE